MGKEGCTGDESKNNKFEEDKTSPTSNKVHSENSKEKFLIKGNTKECYENLEEDKESDNFKYCDDSVNQSESSEAPPATSEMRYEEFSLQRNESVTSISKQNQIAILDVLNDKLCGDVLIRIFHKGSIQSHLICRINVNISLLQNGNNIFRLEELDPCSIHK